MITNRGRWLLLLSICGSALGVSFGLELISFVSLSVLAWIVLEWMLFRWRTFNVVRSMHVTRTVNGGEPPTTLWMSRPVQVQLQVILEGVFSVGGIPFVQLHDFLPAGLATENDAHVLQTSLRRELVHDYEFIPRAAGRFQLPGVCLRMSDLHGLFYAQRFVRVSHRFRVMPSCHRADSFGPMTKPHNSMMPPGMHRFLRAGAGPELLELREYVQGDPPKSIAWKVSARKGSLMTRQYESEVPARVTLFVDGSAGARVGLPGHRAIDSIVGTAATVAKAVMTERDPVGLVQYGDSETSVLKHGNGERHLFRILDALTNMSFRNNPDARLSQPAFDQAFALCEDLYPELLDPAINSVPFTLFPSKGLHQRKRPSRAPVLRGLWKVATFPFVFGAWLAGRWRGHAARMQLAGVMAVLYDLPADGTVRLAYDEPVMARYVYRFLTDHGAPWTDAVYNGRGRNVVVSHGRLATLADTLTRAVAMARDNEVFVLIADLIDHSDMPNRLIDAVRVARARNHRVVVICPWPAPVRAEKLIDLPDDVVEVTQRAEQFRLDEAAEKLRAQFRRLGVPFAMATEGKSIQLVLAEAGMAKDARTLTRVGAR